MEEKFVIAKSSGDGDWLYATFFETGLTWTSYYNAVKKFDTYLDALAAAGSSDFPHGTYQIEKVFIKTLAEI